RSRRYRAPGVRERTCSRTCSATVVEIFAQKRASAVETRLYGLPGGGQLLGDLVDRQFAHVAEDDDLSVMGRERFDRSGNIEPKLMCRHSCEPAIDGFRLLGEGHPDDTHGQPDAVAIDDPEQPSRDRADLTE